MSKERNEGEEEGGGEEGGFEVVGKVVSFNRGAGFLQFELGDSKEEVCLFRPNRLVVNGTKVPAGRLKTLEGVAQYIAFGDEIHAFVTASPDLKPYLVKNKTGEEITLTPRWYCSRVWRGDPPLIVNEDQVMEGEEVGGGGGAGSTLKPGAREILIHDLHGRIVVNQLGTGSGRGNAGQTLISFTNPEGEPDIAMFRHPRLLFLNGKRVDHKEYCTWDIDHQLDVHFSAVFTPGMKEYTMTDRTGHVSTYQPNWRARLVWVGEKPSDTAVTEIKDSKSSKKSTTFLDMIQGCDYLTTRVEKIVNNNLGVITSRNIHILFHIENLSIDGQRYTTMDTLASLLQPGETVFTYAKPLDPPTSIEDLNITHEAVQVWKGRKGSNSVTPTKPKENKSFIPLPSEATHRGVRGSIVGLDAPNLAYVVIDSDNPSIRGQKVLIVKHRFFDDGVKLRFRGSVEDSLKLGDQVHCDIVEANPEQSLGKYEWIAALAWKGEAVKRDEWTADISRKAENLRGRILRFKKIKGEGSVGGILQICLGPSKIGEKVVFTRDVVHINGLNMRNADLAHVLRHNDKVQVEVKEVETSSEIYQWAKSTFDAEISYTATNVLFGSIPSNKEIKNFDESNLGDLNLCPTLAKRGITLDFVISLYNGSVTPKDSGSPGPDSGGSDGGGGDSLPPTMTTGKVIELKRPDTSQFVSSAKVENAIVRIENGPYCQEKAFLHRSSLFCWGYNCAKADLLYLLNETDTLHLDVQSSTNNKAVTCKVTCAWIGPHKSQKNKESTAMPGNAAFMKWLNDHDMTIEMFQLVVKGEAPCKQFFPLATDSHIAKLASFLYNKNGIADAGILRMFQTGNGKDARKAPEVIFSRETFYIWNVPIGEGDLSYLINDADKYFVEVTDLVGKEKRRWQTRMGTENIPKFIATLVYIGGGRPKAARINDSIESNTNLQQWLRKRGMDIFTFTDLTAGKLPAKNVRRDSDEDMYSAPYPNRKENSPFAGVNTVGMRNMGEVYNNMNNMNVIGNNMNCMGLNAMTQNGQYSNGQMDRRSAFLTRAVNLTQRTMQLRTPEDPEVGQLLQDESDAELAIFLSKTLTNAILMFRGTQIGHVNPNNPPGPIGPPRSSQRGRGEFNEFFADGNLGPGGGGRPGVGSGAKGLYGLSTPLLDCHRDGGNSGGGNDMDLPLYKRRGYDW